MRKTLSLSSVNWLYLFSMLLVITIGSALQSASLTWGLILTEVLLILLPTLLALWLAGVPFQAGLRMQPLPWISALLCVMLGMAVFLFSVIIDGIMVQLTHLASVPVPANLLPKGLGQSLLYFLALALFAPLCEETLFRGAIQGAYEQERSAAFAIVITALMFAFYHFRLSGLPALLPMAFILGYVVWRTRSVFAGMLVHFGNNALSALNTLVSISNSKGLPFLSIWTGLGGLLVAVLLIYLLIRLHPSETPAEVQVSVSRTAEPLRKSSWLTVYLPLIGAALLYLGVAWLTLQPVLFPDLSASTDIRYHPPQITDPILSHYQISHHGGQTVGEMDCQVSPLSEQFRLDCTATIQAYEVQVGQSYYKDVAHTAVWSAVWDSQSLELLQYSFQRKTADQQTDYQAVVKDGSLIVTSKDSRDQVSVPQPSMLEYEWFWRANTLNADPGTTWKLPFGTLLRWDDKLKKGVPSFKTELLHESSLELLTPGGTLQSWNVSLAGQTAWYGYQDPQAPRPIQFDDGMLIYALAK